MNNPISRQEELVVQELKGEILIYDLRTDKAFCLNETSGLVWQMCDGTRSAAEISRELSSQLNTKIGEDVVWLALDLLKKENLLSNADNVKPDFGGVTRREAIKKAGLASMIALPVIASLIAPTAAMAQSGGLAATCATNNCACTNGTTVKDSVCGACVIGGCLVCRKQSAGVGGNGYCSPT